MAYFSPVISKTFYDRKKSSVMALSNFIQCGRLNAALAHHTPSEMFERKQWNVQFYCANLVWAKEIWWLFVSQTALSIFQFSSELAVAVSQLARAIKGTHKVWHW